MNKRISSILFFFFLLFSTFIYSQSTLVWTENKEEASKVSTSIKEGKSLLVFNTTLELTFESSIEKLEEIIKKDDLYYLEVTSGAQVITFKNNGNEYSINFGQLMDDNTLPSLKEKEIKYFTITEKKQLEYYNITENERSKGNIGVPVGPNVSDALIIVKLSPTDLNLEIKDVNNIISKIEKENDSYKIFIKTNDSEYKRNLSLNLFESEYGDTEMPIYGIMSKEMRYYLVKKDKSQNKEKSITKKNIPKGAIAYFDLGVSQISKENYNEAIINFNNAVGIAPEYEDAYFNLAKIYDILNDNEKAKKYINKVIELNPFYKESYFIRANALLGLNEYVDATLDYNKAIEIDSSYARAYKNRGNCKFALKDYKGALLDYNKAIEINQKYDRAYLQRGRCKESLKDYESALLDYNKAIQFTTDACIIEEAHVSRSNIYLFPFHNYKEAINEHTKAINIDPNNSVYYIQRAYLYTNIEDYKTAILDYSKAININPINPDYYVKRAKIYEDIVVKNYKAAIKDYSKAIELKPFDCNYYFRRGSLYKIYIYNYKSAYLDFKKAKDLGCKDMDYWIKSSRENF